MSSMMRLGDYEPATHLGNTKENILQKLAKDVTVGLEDTSRHSWIIRLITPAALHRTVE